MIIECVHREQRYYPCKKGQALWPEEDGFAGEQSDIKETRNVRGEDIFLSHAS